MQMKIIKFSAMKMKNDEEMLNDRAKLLIGDVEIFSREGDDHITIRAQSGSLVIEPQVSNQIKVTSKKD